MRLVLDATAGVSVVMKHPTRSPVEEALARAEWVGTPDLYVWEVANALWKYHRFHSVPREQCHGALLQALELPDEYLGGPEFAPEVFALACELSLTAYDAR